MRFSLSAPSFPVNSLCSHSALRHAALTCSLFRLLRGESNGPAASTASAEQPRTGESKARSSFRLDLDHPNQLEPRFTIVVQLVLSVSPTSAGAYKFPVTLARESSGALAARKMSELSRWMH
jgi:hypothetical protein